MRVIYWAGRGGDIPARALPWCAVVHVRSLVAGDGTYSAQLICKHALSALRPKVDGRFIFSALLCGKKQLDVNGNEREFVLSFARLKNRFSVCGFSDWFRLPLGTGVGDLLSGAARRAPVHGRGVFHAPLRLLYHDTLRSHSLISTSRQSLVASRQSPVASVCQNE